MACDTLTFDVQCIILGDVLLELVKQHFSMLAVVKKIPVYSSDYKHSIDVCDICIFT